MSAQRPDSSASDGTRVPHHREMPFHRPDPTTPAGERITRRLHDEQFIWLTTIDESGMPHSLPLGFLWDEAQATFLIYSMPEADRDHMRHLRQNPKVGLHFEMNGENPVVFTGEASISTDDLPSDQIPAWAEKYQALFAHMGMTLQQAAAVALVALRVRPLTMIGTAWTAR